jgi:predicted ATPase
LSRSSARRETELHGRDGDLRTLSEAWEKARNGEGNTVFIEGEAGIGKSRLLDAFLRGLEDKDVHVLYGSYPPSGGLGGVSDAIIEKFGEAMLSAALAPYLTVTPSLVPAFAALVKRESPPTGSEPLQGDALRAVCVHLMRALAREKPLIWLIEDLHFAPKESRDTVLALARAVEGHRVLLVATARSGVPDEELAHFSRLENFQRAALRRLGAREVVELLQDAFKSEALAEKLGAKIALKSDGVPFFVFEMIRGLKEGQFIRQEADGTYIQTQMITDIAVPSAVKDLIEGRLRGLEHDQRRILDAGSVMGMAFDPGLVSAVLEEKRVRVLEQLARIERQWGLVQGEADQTRFDQNQIQEVLYSDLTPALRTEYHTLLAEACSARIDGEPSGEDAVFLASHHLRGSRPKAGLPYLTPALEHLEESFRNETAIELAARGLETPKLLEGKERLEVLLKRAGRHGLRGERETERAALDEALALADSSEDAALRARVRVSLGGHLFRVSDYSAAQERYEQALDLARETNDRKTEGQATRGLGNVLANLARYEEARAHYEKCLALAQDEDAEAASTINLGFVLWSQGRYEEGSANFEKGLVLARSCGNRKWEANATGSLGNVFLDQGRYEEARARVEKHVALSREIGDRQGEAISNGHLGDVFVGLGRTAEAKERFERHRALAREIGYRRGEGYALAGLAGLAEVEENAEGASRLYEEALALRRELGAQDTVAETLVGLARVEAARNATERATTHLDEALALARETKRPGTILAATVEQARLPGGDVKAALAALAEHEERVEHAGKMDARFRLWELTKDKTHLEEARRLLCFMRDHAAEDCLDSMIENVPLHRDITRAWEEHGGS